VTDPSPRAGFTVGSPAEVERSLLPLPPPFPPPFYSFSITKVSPTLLPRFDPSPFTPSARRRAAPRRAARTRPILSLVIYPSSPGVLIPIYRSFRYLSFCVFSVTGPTASSQLPAGADAPSRTRRFSHRERHRILHLVRVSIPFHARLFTA